MSEKNELPLRMQILLLRQKMALQRQLIAQQMVPTQQNTEQFPRSFVMRLLQQQFSNASPWLMALKQTFQGKESTLLWSVALTLGQHWLQKRQQTQN